MVKAKSASAILLTPAAISKLKPGEERRRIRDLGSAGQGLFLIIQPSGHKSWQMRFRRPSGKIGKITLGPVNTGGDVPGEPVIGMPLTLRAARQLAAEINRQRSLQQDVIADHRAERHRVMEEIEQRQKDNFATTAERYVKQHARKHLRGWRDRAKRLGLSYPLEDGEPALIKGGLAERWAERALREIDGHDIWGAMQEARNENRARHLRAALSAMFAWAHRQRLVDDNPCKKVASPHLPEARDRVLTNDEVRWFWKACEDAGTFGVSFKLMLLTGQRRSEVGGMRWDELRDQEWHLPKGRTKNKLAHIVPLAPVAEALIADQPRLGPHVFTSNGVTPISGWSKIKGKVEDAMQALAREERGEHFEIPQWGLHDLRRTAVTGMAELGIRPDVIEQTINHISGSRAGVAGVYNRSVLLQERKEALRRWEAHVLGVVKAKPANIVPLRREKRS